MKNIKPKEVVRNFWETMKSNDFEAASRWLSDDYVCYWPQSEELIRGKYNFIEINRNYPSIGKWTFNIQEIFESGSRVVSDVLISDGKLHARAVTFHTVCNQLIIEQKEFWPDNYSAPEWRSKWVEIYRTEN